MKKIGFFVSHPIQYLSPLLRRIAAEPGIDLRVYYFSDQSVMKMEDKGFGREIEWDVDLLSGYKYSFLRNVSPAPSIFRPGTGLINQGIFGVMKREKFDAVIVHGWHYISNILVMLAAWLTRTPYFIRSEMPLNQELRKPFWKRTLKRMCLAPIFAGAKGFIAIGTQNAQFYRHYGVPEDKIFLTPYAVDNERYFSAYRCARERAVSLRREFGLADSDVVVLFSGKLIEKKRPEDLLKAYELLDPGNKALVFLGDGKLRSVLEEYVRTKQLEKVVFAGFRNQTELPAFYAMSDVFVLPSGDGETWGLVVNEAMCFSLPVIISDVPGAGHDLVKPGLNGYIYKKGDVVQLSGMMERLISDHELRKAMGAASRSIVEKWDYSADVEGVKRALRNIREKVGERI